MLNHGHQEEAFFSVAMAEYKSYRNALNQAIGNAKQMYYHDLLKENQGNCDKMWKIVNKLANIKTKSRTDPNELITEDGKILASSDEIAEDLNEHFATIGPKMAESISPVNDTICMSCDKSCKNYFFLTLSTSYEIINVIDSLSTKKATRSKTKFLKLVNS